MSIWDNFKKATGFDSYGPDMQSRTTYNSSSISIQEEAERARRLQEEIKRQREVPLANSMMGATTQAETPRKPSYPMEGSAIRALRNMGSDADKSLITSLLIDMVTSNDSEERLCAAMHRFTPMSSITMHLLADKNAHVRYMAEKRVEAWEGDERKQEVLREIDDGAY